MSLPFVKEMKLEMNSSMLRRGTRLCHPLKAKAFRLPTCETRRSAHTSVAASAVYLDEAQTACVLSTQMALISIRPVLMMRCITPCDVLHGLFLIDCLGLFIYFRVLLK